MESTPGKYRTALLIVITIIVWFGLVSQCWLSIVDTKTPVLEGLIRYFSYFTILSNGLIALCTSSLLSTGTSRFIRFFSCPQTQTAISVYILVVGLIFNIVLRPLWNATGLQRLDNELLHAVTPPLFLLWWIIYTPKASLQWKNIGRWLIFPALYCLLLLVRGNLSGFYPYPFIDASQLSYARISLNCILLLLAFLGFSGLFVFSGKLIHKHNAGK